jgi:hypothetical protein
LDLAADGGLREEQFLGGRAEVEMPRHRLEGTQGTDRERALAQVIHDQMASIRSKLLIGPASRRYVFFA